MQLQSTARAGLLAMTLAGLPAVALPAASGPVSTPVAAAAQRL